MLIARSEFRQIVKEEILKTSFLLEQEDVAAPKSNEETLAAPPRKGETPWWFHLVLDVIGLEPTLGSAADAYNAYLHWKDGENLSALLSLVSLIPVIGDVVGKGGKILKVFGKTGAKAAVKTLGKGATKAAPKVAKTVKALPKAAGEVDLAVAKALPKSAGVKYGAKVLKAPAEAVSVWTNLANLIKEHESVIRNILDIIEKEDPHLSEAIPDIREEFETILEDAEETPGEDALPPPPGEPEEEPTPEEEEEEEITPDEEEEEEPTPEEEEAIEAVKPIIDEAARILALRLVVAGPRHYNNMTTINATGRLLRKYFIESRRPLSEAGKGRSAPRPASDFEPRLGDPRWFDVDRVKIEAEEARKNLEELKGNVNLEVLSARYAELKEANPKIEDTLENTIYLIQKAAMR